MRDQTIISIVGMILLVLLTVYASYMNLDHGTVAGALAIIGTIVGYSFGMTRLEERNHDAKKD